MLRNAVILQKRKKLPFWSFDIFNWQLYNRNCQMSSVGASFASSLFIFLPNHFVNFKGRTAVVFAFVGVFRLPQHFLDRTARNCFFRGCSIEFASALFIKCCARSTRGQLILAHVNSSSPNNLKTILPHEGNNWNCSLRKASSICFCLLQKRILFRT